MQENRFPFLPLAAGALLVSVGLLALALLRPVHGSERPAFHGTTYEELDPAPALSLLDHAGEPVTLQAYRGRAVLLFFGFTHCPDACPLTLSRLSRVRESLGRSGEEMEVLLVTVDPERDTPEALAEYVARFGPGVTGLTGSAEALDAVYRGYGAYAIRHGEGDHELTHSSPVYGIDREGILRVVIPYGAPEEEVLADVRTLLSL